MVLDYNIDNQKDTGKRVVNFFNPAKTSGYFSQWWFRYDFLGNKHPYQFEENRPSLFTDDIVRYNCAEQYMMAQKALLFNDLLTYNKIMSTNDPYKMKMYGRSIKDFDSKIWDNHKIDVVYRGNYLKFSQDKVLSGFLMATEDSILAERSQDNIWGTGSYENTDINEWTGQNLLGFTLMQVRDQLKKEGYR